MDSQSFARQYTGWLAANKIDIHAASGLDVRRADLHPRLFEYQKDAVLWALQRGHGLLAERFGLGKTTQQIEILRQVHRLNGGGQLVICPLGVRTQFTHEDGPAMGVELNADYYHISVQYLRELEQVLHAPTLFDMPTADSANHADADDVPDELLAEAAD